MSGRGARICERSLEMAKESKNLEERLFDVGEAFESPPSSVEELYSLLDVTDGLLSRVEQSPSQLMLDALEPLFKALVAKDILGHSDTDIKVSVASCISEITRITAPEAPYDDDIMKDIFQMIVGAFEGLDDTASRSYQKRVSILETVAKVRSCVVMLDLECDALILQMFHHFLKTIRSDHSESVSSSMETIMTLVLEESEDISSELLSCLLETMKKDNKDVRPAAAELAEKVMTCCASKLRPCLLELVQSTGASLSEYNKVVASICQENSDDLDHDGTPAYGEVMADDSKLSERTVSDELPQVSAKVEHEVGSPEKVVAAADTSPTTATSNGNVQMGNGDSMDQSPKSKQKSEHGDSLDQPPSSTLKSRRNGPSKKVAADQVSCDDPESAIVKPDDIVSLKKRKGRKTNSSVRLADKVDRLDSDIEAPVVTSRRKGRTKGSDVSEVDNAPVKVEEPVAPSETEKNEFQHLQGSDNPTCDISPSPGKSQSNPSRTKRGRPPGPKAAAKHMNVAAVADPPASESGQKGPSDDNQIREEATPSKGGDLEKEPEDVKTPTGLASNSDVKPKKGTGKKGRYKRRKVVNQETSGKRQKSNMKLLEEEGTHGIDVDGEPTLKEMASSRRTASKASYADETHLDDSVKPKSRRKRALETKEELEERLVGSHIKVWWPDDNAFYDGVVESYDHDTKKHKIVYADGDVEILFLKNERWESAESYLEKDEGKDLSEGSPSQMLQAKNVKMGSTSKASSNTTSKQGKSLQLSKSGTESISKDIPRPRGRPRSANSKLGKISYDDSPGTSKKSEDKPAADDTAKTPRSRGRPKHVPENEPEGETPRSGSKLEGPRNKSRDVTSKSGTVAMPDTVAIAMGNTKDESAKSSRRSKNGRKSKNGTPKSGVQLKVDTTEGDSKLMDDSDIPEDSTPKNESRSEADEHVKSKTPRTRPKTNSSSKSGADSKPNGISSEGKSKLVDSESTTTALDGEATAGGTGGRKRKRKGRK